MSKSFKFTIFSFAIALAGLLVFYPALAQESDAAQDVILDETVTAEELEVAEPSTGFLGFFQNVKNTIQYGLTFNPVKKAELKLKQANQALLKARNYLENNPDNAKAQEKYEKYLEKYEQKMEQVKERVEQFREKAEDNPEIGALLDKVTDNTFKQQRIMDRVSGFLNEDLKAELEEKRERALETFGQVMEKLSDPAKLQDRLENALSGQAGSHLINLKNLEVLKALEDKVPEAALAGIKNAQEQSIKRLNEGLERLDRNEVKERLKEYFDNSNSDPLLQVEILETLNQATGVNSNLRALIPTLRSEKIERVDEMIEEASDDEQKVRRLERIRQIEDSAVKSRLRQIEEKYIDSDASDELPLNVNSLKAEIRRINQKQERKVENQEVQAGAVQPDRQLNPALEQKAELKVKGTDGQVRYEAEYKREDDGREKTEIQIEPVEAGEREEIREQERVEENPESGAEDEVED